MARITKTIPERHQEIIDTASMLFIENGYDKTQITDIAKQMNVAQGLIYYYFKSKTELLYAVIDEMAKEKQKLFKTALSGSESTALQNLISLLSFKLDSNSFGNLIPSIASDAAITEYCSNKMITSTLQMLIMIIKQGNLDGSWKCEHPDVTARFILRGFSGFFDISSSIDDRQEKKTSTFGYYYPSSQ
jgi:AcrR family transcriptional regulator